MLTQINKELFETFLEKGEQYIRMCEYLRIKPPDRSSSTFNKIKHIATHVNLLEICDPEGKKLIDQISEFLKGRLRFLISETINPDNDAKAQTKLSHLTVAYNHFLKSENEERKDWIIYFNLWNVCLETKRLVELVGNINGVHVKLEELMVIYSNKIDIATGLKPEPAKRMREDKPKKERKKHKSEDKQKE